MGEQGLRALRIITPIELKREKRVTFVAPRATNAAGQRNILQL